MIFGKYINRYYLKHAPALLLGLAALLMVDYIQLLIPQLYRLVINGMNLGQVVVNSETLPFTKEVLLQHICLPMIWIVVLMVIGRFLWRVCFFGSAVRVTADLRERMFDHSRKLSQQYYQVNKVGNLMSLYTNDLDTIQDDHGRQAGASDGHAADMDVLQGVQHGQIRLCRRAELRDGADAGSAGPL